MNRTQSIYTISWQITLFHLLTLLVANRAQAQNGSLDLSFGNHGAVVTASDSGASIGRKVVLQPDGKILVVTSIGNGMTSLNMGVYRYLPNGVLDHTFGQGGLALVDGQVVRVSTGSDLALQPDGKILVAGAVDLVGAGRTDFGVARFLPNGQADLSFGASGLAIFRFWDYDSPMFVEGLCLQPDGKILVAGSKQDSSNISMHAVLMRFLPNGDPDKGFADNGVFAYAKDAGTINLFHSVKILEKGKIVVVGTSTFDNSIQDFLLAKLFPNGIPDPEFGDQGIVLTDFGEPALSCSLAIQEDGKMVVDGLMGDGHNVARYHPNGTLDSTFAQIGWSKYRCLPNFCGCGIIGVQKDGKLVVAGSQYNSTLGYDQFVQRVLPNGKPDPTFGDAGWVFTGFETGYHELSYGLAIQPDHKILVTGHQHPGDNSFRTLLVRYNGNFDPVIDPNGIAGYFHLYPNPTTGPLTLEYAISNTSDVRVELYDMLGQRLGNIADWKGKEKGIYQESITLGDWLPTGVYRVHFVTNEQDVSLQVVKIY